LGIFVLDKTIFALFLERLLKILVKFRIGFIDKILIIHILIVDLIVIKIICKFFLIILMLKIVNVSLGVIWIIQRRVKNVLMALNRVLIILDIVSAL
jgi:hypothetical protein